MLSYPQRLDLPKFMAASHAKDVTTGLVNFLKNSQSNENALARLAMSPENPSLDFDSNWPAQPQELARGLNFPI